MEAIDEWGDGIVGEVTLNAVAGRAVAICEDVWRRIEQRWRSKDDGGAHAQNSFGKVLGQFRICQLFRASQSTLSGESREWGDKFAGLRILLTWAACTVRVG